MAIFISSCATTKQAVTSSNISPSDIFAVVPPYLSITDVCTGKEIDNQQLVDFSYQVQTTTQKILEQKSVVLISIEKSNECAKDKDFRQSIEQIIKSGKLEQSPEIFTSFESAGVSSLVVIDIKAKIGTKKESLTPERVSKVVPNPYFHDRDPSLSVVSGIIIDLRKQQIIWKNEIVKRENITKETVLANLLEELFKSLKKEVKND